VDRERRQRERPWEVAWGSDCSLREQQKRGIGRKVYKSNLVEYLRTAPKAYCSLFLRGLSSQGRSEAGVSLTYKPMLP